jgi:hypothetical protein
MYDYFEMFVLVAKGFMFLGFGVLAVTLAICSFKSLQNCDD